MTVGQELGGLRHQLNPTQPQADPRSGIMAPGPTTLASGVQASALREPAIITIWTLVRFIHILSAMAWVGRQLLLSLLVLPVLRRRLDATSRTPLTREVGVRFGVFTVAVFLPLQLVTGIALAANRGLSMHSLAEPGYGRILGAKVALFAAVLLAAGMHGVAVGRDQDRLARLLGVATLLGSVGVVLLATSLVP